MNITENIHNVKAVVFERSHIKQGETEILTLTIVFETRRYDLELFDQKTNVEKKIHLFLNDDFDPQLLEKIATR